METKTVYFEQQGSQNTDEVIALAKKRADELGIKTIVVATHTGNTALKALNIFEGCKVIAVTHAYGHVQPNKIGLSEENRKLIESKKGIILSTTEAFSGGIHEALKSGMPPKQAGSRQIPHTTPRNGTGDIITAVLRMFSMGMKVACEISAMAADSGLVSTDEDIISISGSHRGADTAIVMRPANVYRFFDAKIKEIICKPWISDFDS
jgi:uncharacterized protein